VLGREQSARRLSIPEELGKEGDPSLGNRLRKIMRGHSPESKALGGPRPTSPAANSGAADPEKSKEKAGVLHAIYDRITVAGPEIVGVRLTQAAYAHGLALALPEKVALARPTGVERAEATCARIPIEGADALVDCTA
jgi:hypothetical protein